MSDKPGSMLQQRGMVEELQAFVNPQAVQESSSKLLSGSRSTPWGPPVKLTRPQPPTLQPEAEPQASTEP